MLVGVQARACGSDALATSSHALATSSNSIILQCVFFQTLLHV